MPASELAALLLEVSARRQRELRPAEVARRYAADAFVVPSSVDQRAFAELDAWLLARVPPAFRAVELSPVAPLGTVTTLGLVHPNNVLPTFRGTEVLADCTNVLALEAARRRDDDDVVRLCTSHRLVRTQRVSGPWLSQHFRLFALATAGRDPGGRTFETEALLEHLRLWLALLRDLPPGFRAEPVAVSLAWDARFDGVADAVTRGLDLPVRRDEERLGRSAYYQGLCYKLEVRMGGGATVPLGDGGFVDWVARIRQDRKERLLIGAIGTEALLKLAR
jgi:hypothetical protein